MTIAFDAKRAAQNGTGLGNYSRFLISLLARFAPEESLLLYIPHPEKTTYLNRLPPSDQLQTRFPSSPLYRTFPSLWRSFGITHLFRADGVNLYHGLSGELPLNIGRAKGLKKIVTIHDLLFRRFPHGYHTIDRTIYDFKFHRACRNADRIIAVSEFTKQEIIKYYAIPTERISVVYQGCDPAFSKPVEEDLKQEVRQIYGLQDPFILYVGTIEERKNLLLLARALRHVDPTIKVVAVGRRTPYTIKVEEFLKENRLEHRLVMFHNVPFIHLPALYQLATLFVYPSRCEWFGIPLLEALSSGTPAIGCTGSCLEEAGGPDSIYVDPDDEMQLASAINETFFNNHRRDEMVEKGKAYALRFSDEQLFSDLWSVYEQTLQQ